MVPDWHLRDSESEAHGMRVAIASGVVGLTVCAVAAQKAASTPTFTIDLLTVERPSENLTRPDSIPAQDRLGMRPPAFGGPTDTWLPPFPLEMTLASTDRSDYTVGDRFIYEVLVTNVSKRAIAFPTSVRADRFSRAMAGARWATISLQVEDEMLGRQLVGLERLYGAQSVEGSLLNLGPGESVAIRAGGIWIFRSAFPITPPQTWTKSEVAKGWLLIVDEHDHASGIGSSNALTLSVKK
jgi:hypothetical protein